MKAFPSEHMEYKDGYTVAQDGMDLRDYFAIEYVNGIISNPNFDATLTFEEVAETAYKMADAMMKVREQK